VSVPQLTTDLSQKISYPFVWQHNSTSYEVPTMALADFNVLRECGKMDELALLLTNYWQHADSTTIENLQSSMRKLARTSQEPSGIPAAQPGTGYTGSLIVIHGCAGGGAGEFALLKALGALWTDGQRWLLRQVIMFEVDTLANSMRQIANDRLPVGTTYQNLSGLRDFPGWATNFASSNGRDTLLVMAGTPCNVISKGTLLGQGAPSKRIGLHAAPSNLVWSWYTGAKSLKNKFGSEHFKSFYEQVEPYDEGIRSTLTKMFGQRFLTNGADFGGATRRRDYFFSEELPALQHSTQRDCKNLGLGWYWPFPKSNWGESHPPTIRAIYPELVRRRTFGQPTLSGSEKNQVEAWLIHHPTSGTFRYAGVREVAEWLGFPQVA
jgi:hypothetical protein